MKKHLLALVTCVFSSDMQKMLQSLLSLYKNFGQILTAVDFQIKGLVGACPFTLSFPNFVNKNYDGIYYGSQLFS